MHLAEFILTNIEPLSREWEEFAKSCTPAAIGMTRSTLLDDVTQILLAIANDMEQPQDPAEQKAKGSGQPLSHALGRVAASHVGLRIESRFDLAQIVSEYRPSVKSMISLTIWSKRSQLFRIRDMYRRSSALRSSFLIRSSADKLIAFIGPRRSCPNIPKNRFGEPMPITRARADVGAIVGDIIDEIQCANPRVTIDCAATGDLTGEWDRERLSQLLWNLVVNAIQHGKAKQVGVKVENENDQVLIEVHNDGPPIPQDLIATMFNPLVRERNCDHRQAGLGLGLFICKEIVNAHGGTIEATSTWGAGTIFGVRLNRRAG
jgi:signal transduction histidine kinase